jgi:EAL domain-containing protein (putative c-di-GMP-specific phosphodiesterase class I)
MSVNITSKEFAHPNLAKGIAETLKQTGLDPAYLQLEITETIAMETRRRRLLVLAELKSLGVRLSVDDFGTGYSSSAACSSSRDSVKIDRAFISQMDSDPESQKIVQVIHHAGPDPGLVTVAEGTETEEQVNQLGAGLRFCPGPLLSEAGRSPVISDLLVKVNGRAATPARANAALAGARAYS